MFMKHRDEIISMPDNSKAEIMSMPYHFRAEQSKDGVHIFKDRTRRKPQKRLH